MACCGFSLKSCTNFAAAFTLINFIFFVILDIFLLICIKFPAVFDSKTASPGFSSFLTGFQSFTHSEVLFSLIIIRLILRLLWLVSTPILFIGNRIEKQSFFNSWILIGLCLAFFITFTSAYFLITHYKCDFLGDIVEWTKNLSSPSPEKWAGEEAARFIVFLALFDFGLLFFIPAIILITLVHRRGIQIKYKKREDRLIDTWSYELTPYRIPRVRLNQETNRSGTNLPPLPLPPSASQLQDLNNSINTNPNATNTIPVSPSGNSRNQLIESTLSSSQPPRGRHRHRHHRHHKNYPHHTYHSRQRPVTTADIPSVSDYIDGRPRRSSSTGHLYHETNATIYFEPKQRGVPFNSSLAYDNQALTDDSGRLVKSTSFLTSNQMNDEIDYQDQQHVSIPRSPAMTSFSSPHQYNQNAIYSQSFNEQSISSSNHHPHHLQPVEERFSKRRTPSLEAALI